MKRRPPTKLMRIRSRDLALMREIAKQTGKPLPDVQRELLKYYRRNTNAKSWWKRIKKKKSKTK